MPQIDVTIPSVTSEGRLVQERIIDQLEQLNFPMRDVFGVRLALEEALVNAIKHGNRMDPNKSVRVECEAQEDRVRIIIEDEGEGFNVTKVPDPTMVENLEKPGGRGIMLMRSFMTHIEYNDRGNRLVMEKVLEAESTEEVDD